MKFSLALVFCLVAAVSAEVIYVSNKREFLDALPKAKSGDKIVLKPGEYRGISHLETFNKGVIISGGGRKDVIVPFFEIYGSGCTIEDFYFQDSDVALSIWKVSDITIRRCTFTNIEKYSIIINSAKNVTIADNRFKADISKSSFGIWAKEDGAPTAKIIGNTFTDFATAVLLHSYDGVFEVSNNIFKSNKNSKAIYTCGKNVKIAGNQCEMKSSTCPPGVDHNYYGFVRHCKGYAVVGPSNVVFLSSPSNNTYAAYESDLSLSKLTLCKSNRISVSGNAKVSNGAKIDTSC